MLVEGDDTGDANTDVISAGGEGDTISSPVIQRIPRAQEEIQADSQRLRDQLRKSLSQGQGEFVSVLKHVYNIHKLNPI